MSTLPTPIEVHIDDQPRQIPPGITVAAALALAASGLTRLSVKGEPRAPFCGMGICQECRVQVNGLRRLACQTLCTAGMTIHTSATPQEH
jgi:predicted molibdopterin-dependent oxidoreductase YjgC